MTIEMIAACDEEVENMLLKKAVFQVVDDGQGLISSLFVIPKSSGGSRPIINLKPLDAFIAYEHLKMKGLEQLNP